MKISVILTSYNYANWIKDAINSIINQSYSDWELIVVDDGSEDGSVDIIRDFCRKDERIKFFQHDNARNMGLKASILLGLEHASGEWIAFLESDDVLKQDYLLKKIDVIKKFPDVKLIFNRVDFISEDDCEKKEDFENLQKTLSEKRFPRDMFKDFCVFNQILTFSCVMVEKNVLMQCNFDAPLDSMLDWWLWVHIAYKTKFYYLDEALSAWRLHSQSYIKRKKQLFHFLPIKAYFDVCKLNEFPIMQVLFLPVAFFKFVFCRILKKLF